MYSLKKNLKKFSANGLYREKIYNGSEFKITLLEFSLFYG